MGANPCFCWNIKDGAVTVGLWSMVYSLASLVLFGWQLSVINSCQTVTMSQANLQCEYWCPCVGASNARTSALIEGSVYSLTELSVFGWQSYVIKYYRDLSANQLLLAHNTYGEYSAPTYFENYYQSPKTIFYTENIVIVVQVYCLMQLSLFGWQMAAIKYEKDRAADTLLPNYAEYGRFDIPTYYESYWQSPEERFYIGLFIIQILCLIAAFFLLFASVALIYGAHTFSRCLIWPWIPCMLASILCSLAYCIMWWTGDVRDYWLVLTILEIVTVFINLYCLFVIILFHRQMDNEIKHYSEKYEKFRYRPDTYEELHNNNYLNTKRQPDPSQIVSYHRYAGSPLIRDQYSRVPVDPAPPLAPAPITKTRRTTANDDDLVSSWVKGQQALHELSEHANSEPASPTRPFAAYNSLKHARSVPSVLAEMSTGSCCQHRHCHEHRRHRPHRHRSRSRSRHHKHKRHHSSSRHRHDTDSIGDDPSCSSDSIAFTDYTDWTVRRKRRHRSRSRDGPMESLGAEDSNSLIRKRERDRQVRRGRDDPDDLGYRGSAKRHERGSRNGDRRRPSDSSSVQPAVAIQTDDTSLEAHSPLDQGFTFPQQIIIPPSPGAIRTDGQSQPQTYQINSEIRISYDQNSGRWTSSQNANPVGRTDVAPPPALTHPRTGQQQQQRSFPDQSPTHRPQTFSISSVV